MLFVRIQHHISQFDNAFRPPHGALINSSSLFAQSKPPPDPVRGVVWMTQDHSAQHELRHSLESAGYDITNCSMKCEELQNHQQFNKHSFFPSVTSAAWKAVIQTPSDDTWAAQCHPNIYHHLQDFRTASISSFFLIRWTAFLSCRIVKCLEDWQGSKVKTCQELPLLSSVFSGGNFEVRLLLNSIHGGKFHYLYIKYI